MVIQGIPLLILTVNVQIIKDEILKKKGRKLTVLWSFGPLFCKVLTRQWFLNCF